MSPPTASTTIDTHAATTHHEILWWAGSCSTPRCAIPKRSASEPRMMRFRG